MKEKNATIIRKVFSVLLIVIIISSFFCTVASAAEPDITASEAVWDEYAKTTLNNGFKYTIYEITKSLRVTLSNIENKFAGIFNMQLPTDVQSIITTIINATTQLGRTLCFLYFLIDLAEKASRDSFTAEAFVKSLGKVMIVFVLFDANNINIISDFFSQFGQKIFNTIQLDGDPVGAIYSTIIKQLKNKPPILAWMVLFETDPSLAGSTALVGGALGRLGLFLLYATGLIVGFGRLVELSVYRAMLPIGMSSIYGGGMHSPGFRYFKKCMALELQAAIMAAVFKITVTFMNAGTLGSTALFAPAFCLAGMAVIARSKQISNDVIGV